MMTLDNNIEKRNADTTKNNGTQRLVKNDNPSQKILCSTEIGAICIDTIPIEAQNFKRSVELYCCFIYTLNISLGKTSSIFSAYQKNQEAVQAAKRDILPPSFLVYSSYDLYHNSNHHILIGLSSLFHPRIWLLRHTLLR